MSRRVFVVGGKTSTFIGKNHPNFIWKKHPDFATKKNPTLKDYIVNSVRDTLQTTGTKGSQVQKAFVANYAGELFSSQGHLGSGVAEADDGLMFVPSLRIEGACASGGLAFNSAVDSIRAGLDVALVVGCETQNTVTAREGGDYLARAADYDRQRVLDDFTFPALFALRKKHYLQKYGISQKDIDQVVFKAYAAGNKNPLAHMHTVKLSLKDIEESAYFLGNEELKQFLKLAECSQVSDGSSGLIVVSEEGLKKLGKSKADAIEVIASQVTTGNLYRDTTETFTDLLTTREAAKRAFAEAKVTPQDIQVAEVHDCFAIAEIGMNEALGFSKPGEGAFFYQEKPIVNTGGGLVAFGHPVGATGVKQINEVYQQMKGTSGAYQLPGTLDLGLAANMGGNDKTSVVSIFRNT